MTDNVTDDDDNNDQYWLPLQLSFIAGASTCLGAAIVFIQPKTTDGNRIVSPNTMSFSLALAGSVMVTVSLISILPEAMSTEEGKLLPIVSIPFLQRSLSFILGCLLYYILAQAAFPEPDQVLVMGMGVSGGSDEEQLSPLMVRLESPAGKREISSPTSAARRKKMDSFSDEVHQDDDHVVVDNELLTMPAPSSTKSWSHWSSGTDLKDETQRRAWRVAMLLFVSLLFHNFPEGLAVAASTMESTKLGITVCIGIMIHNIPEGIAIAIPCLAARPRNPCLGFWMASLSGLAEPAGAACAMYFLRKVDTNNNESLLCMGNVLSFVAGIMIMVALYELFPEAKRHTQYGSGYLIWGTLSGIIVMVVTELYV